MKVRLNKAVGIVLLVLGFINALLMLLLIGSNGEINYLRLFICLFLMMIGVAYMRGSYFEITGNTLTMLNLIGNKTQELPFLNKSAFEIKGKNVVFTSQANKKIKLYGYTANPEDWAAFLEWLNQ